NEDPVRAAEDYRKALAHNPKYLDALLGLARAEREAERWRVWEQDRDRYAEGMREAYLKEIAAVDEVISEHPAYVPAYVRRVNSRLDLVQYLGWLGEDLQDLFREAGRDAEEAARLSPSNFEVYILLAWCHSRTASHLLSGRCRDGQGHRAQPPGVQLLHPAGTDAAEHGFPA
ncbi:MAG: hypothetical protein ACYTAF_16080, partial [Planctomycetota bacterium]